MGRLSVVSRPTISSKNSARCEIWYSTVSASSAGVSTPTFPDPVNSVRETKCGTTPSITLAKGTARDLLPRLVIDQALQRGEALGARILRVGVVDVEAGTVRQHGVGQVGLD